MLRSILIMHGGSLLVFVAMIWWRERADRRAGLTMGSAEEKRVPRANEVPAPTPAARIEAPADGLRILRLVRGSNHVRSIDTICAAGGSRIPIARGARAHPLRIAPRRARW